MKRPASHVVLIHSSNEMFGADRVLLNVVESLQDVTDLIPEVWLPDDVQEAADSIAKRLDALGVRTRVLALPILRRRYLSPRHVPGLFIRVIALWLRLVKARPALVYCATSAVLLAAPAARLAGRRRVVLHMQEIWSASEGRLLGVLARFCTTIIAISDASRASIVGPARGRARTIRNGVAERDDEPAPLDPTSTEPMEFIVASRWNAWKGHRTLLAAWGSLDPPPGHLTILGSPPELGQGIDVPGLVGDLPHPGTVTVVGQVEDGTPFIDRADFMIVPSDDPEPFGLVAIEAFARYRPVIGSAGGGLLEIVMDGENGLLFPNRDVARLAGILAGVNRATAAGLGARARVAFQERFSMDRFRTDFAAVWQEIAPRRGTPIVRSTVRTDA